MESHEDCRSVNTLKTDERDPKLKEVYIKTMGKLMATIIRDAIIDNLREHKLLEDPQHGVCMGRSYSSCFTFI